jgi:hypothetical protein
VQPTHHARGWLPQPKHGRHLGLGPSGSDGAPCATKQDGIRQDINQSITVHKKTGRRLDDTWSHGIDGTRAVLLLQPAPLAHSVHNCETCTHNLRGSTKPPPLPNPSPLTHEDTQSRLWLRKDTLSELWFIATEAAATSPTTIANLTEKHTGRRGTADSRGRRRHGAWGGGPPEGNPPCPCTNASTPTGGWGRPTGEQPREGPHQARLHQLRQGVCSRGGGLTGTRVCMRREEGGGGGGGQENGRSRQGTNVHFS